MQPTELRNALKGPMVEARYQPIVNLHNRRPVAFEALARLQHPDYGTLLPERFVPQMEDAGLASRLTDLVASRALADMGGFLLANELLLSLNFPLDVLLVPEALLRLETRCAEAGVTADQVVVELTESRPVQDFRLLLRALETLRVRGYRIAMDDIGPAVPGVDALIDLPFSTIKLDKEVVQNKDDPASFRFIERMISAAKSRGYTIVAEGVEDVATWRRMRGLGADHAQGYLIASPMTAAAVPGWLQDWNVQPSFEE
ncbi:MAG: EAL domain-containing protein [Acetobacteraceae bacterium]|nr:EAL domain-containing protein [Acetobacteraceae bacterium]